MSKNELLTAINNIKVVGKNQNVQVAETSIVHNSFRDFPLSETLLRNIAEKEYTFPTPIQDQTIPAILEGRDVIGIANTGTGKTAAFLIPLINKAVKFPKEKMLIITPTRELALQIYEEMRDFSKGLGLYTVLAIGGGSVYRTRQELRNNPRFVIGTPGRIKDMVMNKGMFLDTFTNVVLDEADRMVDIGFINDVKYFISLLSPERQSLFFSATISGKVAEILYTFVKNPVTVSVKTQDTAENVHQEIVHVVDKSRKIDQLHDMLAKDEFKKVVIFGRTKWGVQKLTNELMVRGFKAAVIHGNKSQSQRQRALEEFKKNRIQILLATDVASRGLDIEDVSHVINYDMPASYDDYVHRIGRTGRANKKGVALTFVE